MTVRLYANHSGLESEISKYSTAVSALKYAADQLYNSNAISYYEIVKFNPSVNDFEYPELSENANVDWEFGQYLEGDDHYGDGDTWCGNSSCTNLRSLRGVHLLVHDWGTCNKHSNSGGGGSDFCSQGGGAFSRGVISWIQADCASGVVRNAAIQETIHQFIRYHDNPSLNYQKCDYDGDGDQDIGDEHGFGKIDSNNRVTPMLTFHVHEGESCCAPDRWWNAGYSQSLTGCTKNAVYYTSQDQCNPQP